VFIQAVDGGLELVGLAGAGVNPKDDAEAALLVRADSAITDPKGLVGKRVAVPGLNALLHVLLRRWFIDNGVDPKKITFVEASFPQMGDILKGGTVDAVVSAGPLKDNILRSGVGKNLLAFGTSIPEGQTFGFYIATRDWAAKNPAVVKALQEAIAEGAAFTQANPQAARVHIGKYVKVPPPVLAAMAITPQNATLTPAQLSWWVTEMRRQDMLRGNPDTSRLIVK
jgi:NitT/TauT family transport system substrate-binding protein